jgi:DNA polymerase zeta
VNTRGDLRPDPKLDAVSCIYLCIRDESIVRAAGHLYRDLLMLLKVRETSNPAEAAKTDSVFDGLAVPRYVRQEYDSEQALLTAFVQFCLEIDPDVIFGYEIQSSSLGYLLDRAQTIKFDLAGNISRLSKHSRSHNSTTSFFDKERDPWGFTHSSGIHVAGRSVVNIWRILRSEIKSTSYTFENTAFHVLHARVPLYTHKTLTNHYNGPASQWRVHLYYLERVQCNLYLLDALNVVGRTSEMARLYGITFFEVLSRGSQFRVESLVMRLTKPHNYILVSPSKQQVAAQLAPECIPLVMEPQSGFYQDPLLVLDFQSLYPSIIIAYNYCYSTCLGRVQPGQGPNNQKKFGASYLSVPHGALDHLKDVLNSALP